MRFIRNAPKSPKRQPQKWLKSTGFVVNNFANPPQIIEAATLDPSDVGDCFLFRHYILVNDRAGNTASAPAVVNLDHRILEHEMGHFLLRDRSGQGGHYDVAQHDATANAPHLMKPHLPHGDFVAEPDQIEIKSRVEGGGVIPPC